MNFKKLEIFFLLYIIFFFIKIVPLNASTLNRKNRWFSVDPGIQIFLHGVDIDGKNNNQIKTSFDFGFAVDFNMPVDQYLAFDIEFAFLRSGGNNVIPNHKSLIVLNYLAFTQVFKFYPIAKLGIKLGLSHQFLISAQGKLIDPIIDLAIDKDKILNPYNMTVLIGLEYTLYSWSDQNIDLVGAINAEFGLINLLKIYLPTHQTIRFPILSLGLRF